MLDTIFSGIFDSGSTTVIAPGTFIVCVVVSLLLGLTLAGCYMYKSRYTKGFVATLALLPAAVCVVIMMVNGNVGTGVAVAGAFSLVRFRSVAGSAKEIGAIFVAMTVGLISGMGYLGFACLAVILLGGAIMLFGQMDFGSKKQERYKTMNITIPEDLDYSDIFTDLFEEYTDSCSLETVKTTNMGSLFKLTYQVVLKDTAQEKELIDKIRTRNGNLEISVSTQAAVSQL